jgi:Ca-activated chloride channel family protein
MKILSFVLFICTLLLWSGCEQKSPQKQVKAQNPAQQTQPVLTQKPPVAPMVERDEERLVASGARREKTDLANEMPAPRSVALAAPADVKGKLKAEAEKKMQAQPAIPEQTRPDETQTPPQDFNTEAYSHVLENPFLLAQQNPLSTFSIDVDTASYSNMRRFLSGGSLPPKDSIRIEELVNYFPYDYEPPKDNVPFAAHMEIAGCPWNMEHRLARIAIKGKEIDRTKKPACNLVFLLDVSGSMSDENKLPLLKQAFTLLVKELGEKDRVAIVVYAGASGLALPSTSCVQKEVILASLERLNAGGSTNGGAGIQLAYNVAVENFIKDGVNRVILATDGDFNVGTTGQGDLVRMIEEKARKSKVFLTVLGFGMGNYKDSTLQLLADKGNGNYGYIDTLAEAKKALVEQLTGTLITIAKDVKIQIEFNPAKVAAYRLVGYEKRMLRAEDFKDDTKDAGEIGAGHTITVFYELVPAGKKMDIPDVDPLKYQTASQPNASASDELLTLKLRYKDPDSDTSKPLEFPINDSGKRLSQASGEFKFAAAVSTFAMILRDSKYKGNASLDQVLEIAAEGKGNDKSGYRAEFIELVKKAKGLLGK